MPGSAPHHFRLDIAPLFQDLQVLSFAGKEAISELFVFELEVVIDAPALDVAGLMYRAVFLAFNGRDAGIHGQIHGVMRSHFRPGPACYQLTIGPRLACLAQRYTPRIFQYKTAKQIIRQVLREHGIRGRSYRFDLKAECRKREYCAQFQESDLELVQRLCAEEGIHYHFEHSREGHELVFGDGLRGFPRASSANFQQAPKQAGVVRFSVGAVTGDLLEGARQSAEGESTLPFISSGHLLPLKGHPDAALNHLWLVTNVEHKGVDPRQLEAATGTEPATYLNHFRVAPWQAGFRPKPKPRAFPMTIQRAQIVGVEGEAVRYSADGRVKALFDWVGQGLGAAHNYCWLPIDERLKSRLLCGMQVVVGFEEGDIDQPTIIAALWRASDPIPQPSIRPSTPDMVDVHMGLATVMGDKPSIQIDAGVRAKYEHGREMSFCVGDSRLTIDASGARLSSAQVLFASSRRAQAFDET